MCHQHGVKYDDLPYRIKRLTMINHGGPPTLDLDCPLSVTLHSILTDPAADNTPYYSLGGQSDTDWESSSTEDTDSNDDLM